MKKIFPNPALLIALLAILAVPAMAFAHDHWVGPSKTDPGQKATIIRGFGHGFPEGEAIPEGRDSVFTPITILEKGGAKSGIAKSDANNFTFVSEKALDKGTYLLYSEYSPTYWSETPGGREQKPKNEVQGATSCRHVAMYAKSVLNVGGAAENDPAVQVLDQKLEFVPESNPGALKVGDQVKIKILYDGKPLPREEVKGLVDGLPKGVYPFFATTGKDGVFTFVPLKAGNWILTANKKEDIADKTVCDEGSYTASLFFRIE